ncbi:hypothetical protein [Adhaeribacter radiodurans]|uniref:Uncharacterized protein n=1 Tax=Adhaeribacter radiodurans TaxID=2745197 RepID=A0A7L7LA96_9BACT|nr:hypothetical protein [Adhaeribacter radiodurans]QMU29756.1 hypothetical protein HUW48_17770 [Adhaeribacter radiodurans]
MARLLDYIFSNLEEKNLNRSQVEAYIRYLDEIILQGLPLEKDLAFQKIKLQLLNRLHQLNQQQIQFYWASTMQN